VIFSIQGHFKVIGVLSNKLVHLCEALVLEEIVIGGNIVNPAQSRKIFQLIRMWHIRTNGPAGPIFLIQVEVILDRSRKRAYLYETLVLGI
jgi:hypothetical protein